MAQKLTGVTMETEDRGENGDDLMTPVNSNSDLELSDLQLNSGCHDSGDIGQSKKEVNGCKNSETLFKDSQPSVLSSLCLKAEQCNMITTAKDSPTLEKII